MSEKISELVELREKNRYTQTMFAKKCNVTRQYINLIESGKYRPRLELMLIMADVLGVSALRIIKMFTQKN